MKAIHIIIAATLAAITMSNAQATERESGLAADQTPAIDLSQPKPEGITILRYEHYGVTCWVYKETIGYAGIGGISCVPDSQMKASAQQ